MDYVDKDTNILLKWPEYYNKKTAEKNQVKYWIYTLKSVKAFYTARVILFWKVELI